MEEAFKNLKGDLGLRPIFHQKEERIEAHIFVAFLAYCLHVTLGRQLRDLAPDLTPRSALEKFASLQMIDVHLPTSDGRQVVLTRYTQPEPDLDLSAPFETGVASSVPTQNYRLSDRSPSQASVVKTLGILSLIPNSLQLSYPPIRQVGLVKNQPLPNSLMTHGGREDFGH